MELDPTLKALIEAHSAALAALLSKIASGETSFTEEIAELSATDADLKSALAGLPESPSAA